MLQRMLQSVAVATWIATSATAAWSQQDIRWGTPPVGTAGHKAGVALANLWNLLSPQLIIVGGELALAGDVLLSAIRESMTRRAVSVTAQATQVVSGVLAERTGSGSTSHPSVASSL